MNIWFLAGGTDWAMEPVGGGTALEPVGPEGGSEV